MLKPILSPHVILIQVPVNEEWGLWFFLNRFSFSHTFTHVPSFM